MDSLPVELLAEILAYVQAQSRWNPVQFQGYQLALTCRALYDKLLPSLVGLKAQCLGEAYARGDLRVAEMKAQKRPSTQVFDIGPHEKEKRVSRQTCSDWIPAESDTGCPATSTEQFKQCVKVAFGYDFEPTILENRVSPGGAVGVNNGGLGILPPPHYQLTYVFQSFDAAQSQEMWSLHSFLSTDSNSVIKPLCCVRLVFGDGLWAYIQEKGFGAGYFPEWHHAFAKLLEVIEGLGGDGKGVMLEIFSEGGQQYVLESMRGRSSGLYSHEWRRPAVWSSCSAGNANFSPLKIHGGKAKKNSFLSAAMRSLKATKRKWKAEEHRWIDCWELESRSLIVTSNPFPPKYLLRLSITSPALRPPNPRISRLTHLHLQSCALHPFWFAHLQTLLRQTATTLQHLHLDGCAGLSVLDWHAMVKGWPRFTQLNHFTVAGSEAIPVPVLISFLHTNPGIELMEAHIPLTQPGIEATWYPSSRDEIQGLVLSVREIRASVWVLRALFSFSPVFEGLSRLVLCCQARSWRSLRKGEGDANGEYRAVHWEDVTEVLESVAKVEQLEVLELRLVDDGRLHGWLGSATRVEPTVGKAGVDNDSQDKLAKVLGSFQTLRTLRLVVRQMDSNVSTPSRSPEGNSTISLDDVLGFLSAFPALRAVFLQGFAIAGTAENAAAAWRVCKTLETMEISDLENGSTAVVLTRGETTRPKH
ncbi:hypothetical protein DFP72DRAFT_856471 [Ephemerocybe angulata]|uniref:Uncharacterized protein n=1 Tax=Ephemerocybe angulata TaxID=980116 RepID=A0A8H6HFW6_9AGAR|nr:hypothetical protein DFP72DRAFT_856471 [Tulosesus angulatus]